MDIYQGSPGGSDGTETACNAEDPGSISGLGRSPKWNVIIIQSYNTKSKKERETVCVNFYIQNSVATLKYRCKFSYSQINVYIIYVIQE